MGHDVDKLFSTCMEGLEASVEQDSKFQKDAEPLDDILCQLVFNWTVKSKAYPFKTFIDTFYIWQRETQTDINFFQNFLRFLDFRPKKRGCREGKNIRVDE